MMLKVPLVSVLIPAYNHEKYVQETIRSIIKQTYSNIELLVLDDGSTDSTFSKINELKSECLKRFATVQFLTQANSGICNTLNTLFSIAKGEYVYIIASDDLAVCEAIETLLQSFDTQDTVLAVGDNAIIDCDSNIIGWGKERSEKTTKTIFYSWWEYNCFKRPELINIGDNFGSYDSLLKGGYLTNGYLIRASALKKTGGWRDGTLDDWYMQLQLAKIGKFKFVNKKLCLYRWHGANTAGNSIVMRKAIALTKKYEEELVIKSENKELLEKFYANIDYSPEFYNALDEILSMKTCADRSDFYAYYKKIRHHTKKQLFFYVASFIPCAFAILRMHRKIKNRRK